MRGRIVRRGVRTDGPADGVAEPEDAGGQTEREDLAEREDLTEVDALTILTTVDDYSHRNPPSDADMARLRRLATDAADPLVRSVVAESLADLETLREIDSALAAVRRGEESRGGEGRRGGSGIGSLARGDRPRGSGGSAP